MLGVPHTFTIHNLLHTSTFILFQTCKYTLKLDSGVRKMLLLKISFGILNFVFLFNNLYSYNLDSTHPLVIGNLADGPESHFGATVELLRKGDDDISWIFVGAPKANSTYPKHVNIKEPGVIYRCSIGKENDVCEIVMMDPTGVEVSEKGVQDRKDGGWLGGSLMAGDSSRLVTCASRWSNQKYADPVPGSFFDSLKVNEFLFHGICYWRNKNDVCEETLPELPKNYRLLPLSGIEDLDKQGGHKTFYWTYGQSGFSMHVTRENSLILGAPGMYSWRGNVIRYYDNDETGTPLQRNGQPNANGNAFSKKMIVRPELNTFVKNDSYFGYSVTSGKFAQSADDSNEHKIQYASGAPRGSDLRGKVVFFNFPKTENDSLIRLDVIEGIQIGAYFGSVLCAVDLNNDGYDDLLIGAPRYSTPKYASKLPILAFGAFAQDSVPAPSDLPSGDIPQERLKTRGDEGAVFVYISTGQFPLTLRATINGDNEPWAQFGTAISSPGDLNRDGFNDLVVGAPYSQQGKGAIYIYHGSYKGIDSKYAQVIFASQVDWKLRGFGFSVSRGLDFDNNGFNDVAVGSYDSAQVVIFRSRPAVNITGVLKTDIDRLPLNATEFSVFSCITYTGFKLAPTLDIGVRVFIDVDAKPHRVLLRKRELDGSTSNEETYEELAHKGIETCTKLSAIVVRPLSSGHPIKMRQQVFIPEKDSTRYRGRRSTPSSHATYYDIQRNSATGSLRMDIHGASIKEFCSTCPMMDSQQENTTVFNLPLEVLCGNDEKCVADLRVEASFLNIGPGNNFTMGSSPSVVLLVNVTNFNETAVAPAVIISFTRRNLVRTPPSCESIQVNSVLHFKSYKCSLGRKLEKDQVAEMSMEFDMSDLVAGDQDFELEYLFKIEATTSSELINPAVVSLILAVNASADVHLIGSKYDISFSKTTLANYQILSHNYQVRLHGKSTLSSMWLHFQIPVNLTNARGSIEVLQVLPPQAEVDGTEMMCANIGGKIQKSSTETSIGRKRTFARSNTNTDPSFDAVMIQTSISKEYSESEIGRESRENRQAHHPSPSSSPSHSVLSSGIKFLRGNTLLLDCFTETVDCMEIVCKFTKFKPTSRGSVILNMRISSNVTRKLFDQEYASTLDIQTKGEIILKNMDAWIQGENVYSDKSVAITVIKLDEPKKVSRWIVMGSIVGGILLLLCIVFCLYSCGFLQKKKKPIFADEVDGGMAGEQDEDEEEQDSMYGDEEEEPLQDALISVKLETIEEHEEEHSS